jgi:DNA-binding FadR family transcriptional regulator
MFGFNMATHLPQVDLSSYTQKHERIVDAIAEGNGDLAEQQIVILSNDTRDIVAQERSKPVAEATTTTSRGRQRRGRAAE